MRYISITDELMHIYKITNQINGKLYVGQTVKNVSDRWKDHLYIAKGGKEKYPTAFSAIHAAIVKYDETNFSIQQIDTANNTQELDDKEIYWIRELKVTNTLYNLTDGGRGSSGHIVSEETKAKISIANTGENNPFYGKQHSPETRQKYSAQRTGLKHTDSTKKIMSENQVGRIITEEIAIDIINRLKNHQPMIDISRELEVGYSVVNGIKRYKNWKHLSR
jgi:group I intron endonuclease